MVPESAEYVLRGPDGAPLRRVEKLTVPAARRWSKRHDVACGILPCGSQSAEWVSYAAAMAEARHYEHAQFVLYADAAGAHVVVLELDE